MSQNNLLEAQEKRKRFVSEIKGEESADHVSSDLSVKEFSFTEKMPFRENEVEISPRDSTTKEGPSRSRLSSHRIIL